MCASCLKEHKTEDGDIKSDWTKYINTDEEDEYVDENEETGEMASVIEDSDLLDDEFGGDDFDDDEMADSLAELDDEDDDLDEDDDFEDDFEDEDDDFDFDDEDEDLDDDDEEEDDE